MEIFDKRENEYLKWLEDNLEDNKDKEGYVINSDRQKTSPYQMLHKATCGRIGPKIKNHTTGDYFKICSLDKNELEIWAKKHNSLKYCGHCNP